MKLLKACILFFLAAVLPLLPPRFCPAMPAVTKIDLPNQLKVLVFQEHSVPAVTLQFLIGAGSSFDPHGMEGLANLTARSLSLGTRTLSFDQINDRLDFLGATYGVECTRDFVLIGMQVLKKDLAPGVDLFTQMLEHPSFGDSDIELKKEEIVGRLREEEDNPLEIAKRSFDRALFLKSPYAGAIEGGKKSVAAIAPGQVAIFYSQFYRPDNAVLVVGGDITPGEVRTKIIPKLLGWKAGPVAEPTFRTQSARGAVKVDIDRPISQAVVIIGCSAMKRSSPDYYPFLVLSRILGSGALSGRLSAEIRTRRGLAYAVQSRLAAYKHAGAFRVVLRTRNGSVEPATALVQKELARLREKPVSEAELKAAKDFMIGNFPLEYSLPENFAKFLAESEFYGLGPEYLEKYPSLIESVTPGDIQRVARKYLTPQNVVVVVGDLRKINSGMNTAPPAPAPQFPGPAHNANAPAPGPPKPAGN
ncbi:MAG: M16 family metallopeptidase [Syntrophobacteraceae bacterium]